MSQENVDIVRRGYDAFNRGDVDGVVGRGQGFPSKDDALEAVGLRA